MPRSPPRCSRGASATSTSTSPARRGRLRQLPQARRTRPGAPVAHAARAARQRAPARCSTTSSARSRRPSEHEEAKLVEGVRLVDGRSRRCSRRRASSEIETDGPFDPHVHEALLAQPARAPSRARAAGGAARLPARRQRRAARAGDRRGVGASGDIPYEVARRPQERVRRRDQEGVPQARARAPPRPNPGDAAAEEQFKDVQGAYDMLSDAEKREAYDASARRRARRSRRGPGRPRFEEVDLGDLCDLLGGMFGGGRRAAREAQPSAAHDLETRVRISFEDSLEGVQVRVPVEIETVCSFAAAPAPSPEPRRSLPAVQRDAASSRTPRGSSRSRSRARAAAATARSSTSHARLPRLRARARTKRYDVKIPAGAKDGTRIRLKGKGEPGATAGRPATCYVVVEVEPSQLYERRGADLVLEVPVTYAEAALGAIGRDSDPGRSGGAQGARRHARAGSCCASRVAARRKLKGGGKGDLLARVEGRGPEEAHEGGEGGARGLPEGVARASRATTFARDELTD